jgi:probable phosphoglycerate mutase
MKAVTTSMPIATGGANSPVGLLRVYFIRHGETEWSLSGRHTGVNDIPLTEHGEDEAAALGGRLHEIEFSRVLTSPQQRARRTCELAGLGPSIEVEPDLVEWNYGDYEGRRSVDICRERADWNLFRDGCPDGESPEQVSDRADRLIAYIRKMEGNVALFSHGQFGAVFSVRWIGLPVAQGQHFSIGAASINILSYDQDHLDVPVIALLNMPGFAPNDAESRSQADDASYLVSRAGNKI